MKLFRKLADVPPAKFDFSAKDATRFFLQGLEKHAAFSRGLKQMRKDAIEAGFFFLQARSGFPHGDWEIFLDGYRDKISRPSVHQYMQLADLSLRWARYKHGDIKHPDALRDKAIEMVLVSPKPIIALARELGHMLKFGGYFEEDYQAKKSKRLGNGPRQIEFSFAEVHTHLELLTHLGDDNFAMQYPEGKDEVEALVELETKLEAALARVRQIKQHGRILEA